MSQELTIALANFDRHMPFFMNWLPPASGFHPVSYTHLTLPTIYSV